MIRLIIMLMVVISIIGCRIPSTSEIVAQGDDILPDTILTESDNSIVNITLDGTSLDCGVFHPTWAQREDQFTIVTLMSQTSYTYGDIGWIAVMIKHSSRLPIEESSDRIAISATNNIEILEAVGSELLPYEVEVPKAPQWKTLQQIYHVPLDYEYRALVLFRYLATETDEYARDNGRERTRENAWIDVKYGQKITPPFSYGDSTLVSIVGNETFGWVEAEKYCHPNVWNTIPDDGSILHPIDPPRAFTKEEWSYIIDVETTEEVEVRMREIIAKMKAEIAAEDEEEL